MLFTSPEFVFAFLPLTFLGFWLLSAINQTAAIMWVTAASLYFYAFWEVSYLWLLVPSIGSTTWPALRSTGSMVDAAG